MPTRRSQYTISFARRTWYKGTLTSGTLYIPTCVCKLQTSIDCKFWDVSFFTDGGNQPLQDEMRRKGWRFPVTGRKSGHKSSALPVGSFRLLDFAFDSCDPDWEAGVRCHHLRQGEIQREKETWTNG